MRQFFIIFVLLLLSSCTTLIFQSKNSVPTFVSIDDGGNKKLSVEMENKRDFYLWGILPKKYDIYIDDEFRKYGLNNISNIEIEEYQTFSDVFFTVLTFGMYVPISYKLSCVGDKTKRD